MSSKASVLLGLLVGALLAGALLVPQADPLALAAQGLTDLLAADEDSDRALFLAEREAGAPPSTLFGHLDRLARGDPAPRVALTVRLDGEPLDDVRFRRAFGTALNRLDEDTGREGEARLALATDPAAATLALELQIERDGDRQRVRARLSRGDEQVLVPPADAGPGATLGGAPWARPGRTALVPPLLAIGVALLLRRTLLALFAGILAGAVLLAHEPGTGWPAALGTGLLDVFRHYLLDQVVDSFRIEIIGFVVALVAMVGVMSRSGGVAGLVELLLGYARTVRSTLLATWGMGLLIFFDDYANCLLVGNTMRPLTDKMRIAREKLAYIVDSTAAPIAGVSLLSTWIAFEVSTFQPHLPGAGITENAYAIFLQTLPYRYYCWFTLAMVALVILTGRDFGPMRRAEERARRTGQLVREGGVPMVSEEATRIEPRAGMPHRWWMAALPLLLVLVTTLLRIFVDGGGGPIVAEGGLLALFAPLPGAPEGAPPAVTAILFAGSGAGPIFLGACAGLWLALFLAGGNLARLALAAGLLAGWTLTPHALAAAVDGEASALQTYGAFGLLFAAGAGLLALAGRSWAARAGTPRPHLPAGDMRRAALSSVRSLFFAVVILFEAWMIGAICADMKTADYLVALLSGSVTPPVLPVLLFVAACLVSFSTGSSWSTMSILLPNVVALAAAVGVDAGLGALPMVVVCIGAVLEGSIFGDHCSPISDTTVLSSVSSASDHVDHVRTQAPYALTTAAVAILVGYLPTVAFPWWDAPAALATGVACLALIVLLLGRRAPEGETPPPAPDTLPAPAGDPLTT